MLTHKLGIIAVLSFTVRAFGAEPGTMLLKVRDSQNGYAVRANIAADGANGPSGTADAKGIWKAALAPGEYNLRISASGYAPMKTYLEVKAHKVAEIAIVLDRLSIPAEEDPRILSRLYVPGHTLLHGYVVDDDGHPIAYATVRLGRAGARTKTDAKGHFELSIPTPPSKYPGGLGVVTLFLSKPGYITRVIPKLGIAGEDMSLHSGLSRGHGIERTLVTPGCGTNLVHCAPPT